MLKNKKKLRRMERNTPGYAVKTAQSLVLAGALVLGGAGMAVAADLGSDATGWNVQVNGSLAGSTTAATVIAAGQELILNSASTTKSVYITGSETYATNNNSITITGGAAVPVTLAIGNAGAATVINAGSGIVKVFGVTNGVGTLEINKTSSVITTGGIAVGNFGVLKLTADTAASNAATVTGNVTLDGTNATLIVTGGNSAVEANSNYIGGNLNITNGAVSFTGATDASFLTVKEKITIGADSSFAVGTAGNGATSGFNNEVTAKNVTYSATGVTALKLGADGVTDNVGAGGNGTLTVTNDFTATTALTIAGGKGGNGATIAGGNGGNSSLKVTGTMTAEKAFMLVGGAAGNKAANDGGNGGTAELHITGTGIFGALNIEGGAAGTGSGNGVGGNASMIVENAAPTTASSLTATSITLKGNSGSAGQQGTAKLDFKGGSLNVAEGTVSLEGLTALGDAALNIGASGQTIGTTANIGTLQFGTANDKFGTLTLAGAAGKTTHATVNTLTLGTNGAVAIGADSKLTINGNHSIDTGNFAAAAAAGKISFANNASAVLHVTDTLTLTNATPGLSFGTIIAKNVTASNASNALTLTGGNNNSLVLLGSGLASSPLTAGAITLAAAGQLQLGHADTAAYGTNQGGTITNAFAAPNGTISVAAGDWKITNNNTALDLTNNGSLKSTGGTLEVALGANNTLTVNKASGLDVSKGGKVNITGTGGLTVAANSNFKVDGGTLTTTKLIASAGGKNTIVNGTVEVTGTATDSYTATAGKVEVGNLGILKVDFSQAWNKTNSSLVANGVTDVLAGGTLMLTGGADYSFTTATLTTLKGILNAGSTGLLNLGAAKIAGVTTNGSVKYTDVSGVTSNDLLTSTATGTTGELAAVSGGFKNLEITGTAPTADVAIAPTSTLQLVGSANGVQLVAGLNGHKALVTVADGNALIFGVVGNDVPQTKGTLTGDVTLTDGIAGKITNFNAVNGDFIVTGDVKGGTNGSSTTITVGKGTLEVQGGFSNTDNTAVNLTAGGLVAKKGSVTLGAVSLDGGQLANADKATTTNTTNGNLTTGAVTIMGAGNFIGAGNDLNIASFTDGTATGAGKISNAIIAAGANFAVTGSVDTIASNALFVITGDMSIANNKTLTADKSTLNVGGLLSTGTGNVTLMESAGTIGQLTTTGTLSLNHGSNITLSTTDPTKASSVATLNVGDAVVTGTAGSGSAANLDVKGKLSVTTGGAIYNGSTVTVNELDNATGIINVGSKDDTKGSSLIINKLTAASTGTFFVDPAAENSIVQVKDTTTALTQDFIAGNNGIVSFGERGLEWTKAQIAESGMTKPSVLVLASPVTLDTNAQILVGDKYTSDKKWDVANNAGAAIDAYGLAIRGNSLVIADATNWAADVTGIKLAGTGASERNVLIEKTTGLRLYADNLKAGETRTLVSGIGQAEQVAGTALADKANLAFEGGKSTNYMLVGVGDVVYNTGASNTGFITASTTLINATSVLPKLSQSMGTFLDGMATNPGFNSESENAGIRFVSRALDRRFLGVNDPQKAAATIEGAAQMAAVAGVQVSTIGAASVASGAVTTRTSFAQPLMDMTKAVAVHQDNDGALSLDTGLNAGNGMKNGLGVWIMPLYQSNKTWGQKAENFKSGMNSDLGGIALGADYTINDMFRFGAAFNVGAGYGQSTGDFNKTENRFNFWGVNLYGGWTMNNFGLSADVGYTSTFNAVKQDTPASLQMGNLKSDVTSSALQAGLKAEYKLETSVVDIIPHVGVRYMGLATDGYDVKSHGTVFSVERDFQSIWTFPIGVAFSKTITSDSGWMFKPMVDLSVVPAAGDIKAKSKTSIPGVGGQAEMKMQVVDTVTFDGGLGFEVGKDNLSFGLNYNVQASEHRTGHGVFGTLRYEF